MNHSGLAVEAAKILTEADGAIIKRRTAAGVRVTDVTLGERAAEKIGKHEGRYITLEGECGQEQTAVILGRAIKELVCGRRIFFAGLGNPDVTHDSLGALCAREIVPRSGGGCCVSVMETDVAARTGIDTARLVRAAAREVSAECVIAIDAMACANPRRIGKTVQLSDAGFVLGAGAGHDRGEISHGFLGIPTVAIGVPTMTALASLTKKCAGNFLVTTEDIDLVCGQWAKVIARAINVLD